MSKVAQYLTWKESKAIKKLERIQSEIEHFEAKFNPLLSSLQTYVNHSLNHSVENSQIFGHENNLGFSNLSENQNFENNNPITDS